MHKILGAVACAAVTFLSIVPAQAQTAFTSSSAIDAAASAFIRDTHTPAATVMVVQHGQVVYARGFGYSNVAKSTPAGVATHYEIGSMTKQFTAAAVVQLQEAGKLSINDKISKYLPDAPHGSKITIRQLLTQRTGLTDYLAIFGTSVKVRDGDAAYAKIAAAVSKEQLHFIPGSKHEYSNTNYIVLGKLVEVVSKQPYEAYVREHEWKPAGMTQTSWVANEANIPDMALGYDIEKGKLQASTPLSDGWAWSAGAIVSTVGDFNTWSDALASGKIVSSADYALMTTADASTHDTGDSYYAFGLAVERFEGQPEIEHNGGTIGFRTDGAYFPKQDTRIVAFTNSGNANVDGLVQNIYNILHPEFASANLAPAVGEDLAVTTRLKTFFTDLLKGTIDRDEMTPAENEHMSDAHVKATNEQTATFGALTSFVYKGKTSGSQGTVYTYMLRFSQVGFLKALFTLDPKTNKLAAITLTSP